jgi:hypothetical protein
VRGRAWAAMTFDNGDRTGGRHGERELAFIGNRSGETELMISKRPEWLVTPKRASC